jgi:methyl-accepting chemotaxis protein
MNTQIASAAEEQGSVAEEINRNIVNITEVANQTASGAQQTASASDELARLAGELQRHISQFRV